MQFKRADSVYNKESNRKICVARLKENSIFFDVYDYDLFLNHIFQSCLCPVTNKPLSNYFDFLNVVEFDKKSYVLSAEQFEYVEQLLSLQDRH